MKFLSENDIMIAPFINKERLGADFGKLMVLAPHPDDESLGCGGLISLLSKENLEVAVVFVTDGTASHTSKTHPPEVLRKIREREALLACKTLGVRSEHVYFMAAKDSGLSEYELPALNDLAEQIIFHFQKGDYRTLAIPWRRDPHPDHRAVNRLGSIALGKLSKNVICIEYPIWLWVNGKKSDWPSKDEIDPYRLDISNVVERKWSAIQKHRSQLGEMIFDDPNGFILSEAQLEPFRSDNEVFFITKHEGRTTLPKTYFEELYRLKKDPWNFKTSAYEKEKYENSISALGKSIFDSGLELGCSIGVQTRLLAGICKQLTAVDISEEAIDSAIKYCREYDNINFLISNIADHFPKGNYDMITCCEIGYYLQKEDLLVLFSNMVESLTPNGRLLMIHWTPFVPDYPLTGDDVHNMFERYAKEIGNFKELVFKREDTYRLQVWTKLDSVKTK